MTELDRSLVLYVIFRDPTDFPGRYVVRAQWASPGRVDIPAEPLAVVDTLDQARAAVPPGLFRLNRSPDDEPQIVECWL